MASQPSHHNHFGLRGDAQHHLYPSSSPSASSSEGGHHDDAAAYSSTSTPANSSGPSSPKLSEEQQKEFLEWQRHDAQHGHFSSPRSRATSRRSHARRLSEQLIESVERIAAPIRGRLFPSTTLAEGDEFEDPYRKATEMQRSSSAGRSSRPSRLSSRQAKWLLRIVLSLTGFLFMSALLPRSSPMSLWHFLSDRPLVTHVSEIDIQNQKLASGKGWGWRLGESLREGTEAPPAPEDATVQQHNYAYGLSEGDNSTDAAAASATHTFPDIRCQLDVAAFAHHYKLTSNFKYTRRYVTAKPSPPDVNQPVGFDPSPRQLSESLVNGWDHLSWRGIGVTPEQLCKSLSGKAKQTCVAKQTKKQQQLWQQQQQQSPKRSLSDGSPSESRARLVAEKRFARTGSLGSTLSPLQSCASSQTPMELPTYPVPRTRTQPHHLILGLASDVERLFELMPEMAYSFSYSNLHLLLNLPPDSPRLGELRKALRARGIRATLIQSTEEDYLRRWVELPSLLADFADPNLTRWAMVADDDTFWLSLPKLLKMLDKYDYTRSHYIGALTDDWRQSDSGMIAYGGGGVILSMPLLEELQPHWSTCKESKDPADHRLALCIYANTHTRLTIEWGLLQTDLHGDIRGLLESGKDITTMHHWRSWNTGFDPVLIARAGAVCGSECLLQRFLANGTSPEEAFMFVHGLSISLYPTLSLPDFGKTEVTWKVWGNSQFSHSMGPTRQRVREGRPPLHGMTSVDAVRKHSSQWRETWTLEDVRLDSESGPANSWDMDGRGIREIYIKRANRPKGYLSTNMYDQEKGQETGRLSVSSTEDEDEDELSPADRHKQLESNVKGLVGKLFGLGSDEAEQQRQDDLVRQQVQQEEEDSVIELVWI